VDVVGRVQENDCLRCRREEVCFGRWSREDYRSLQDIVIRGIVCFVFARERIDVIHNRVDGVLDENESLVRIEASGHVWTHVGTTSSGQQHDLWNLSI
jgi:hypothetical protein